MADPIYLLKINGSVVPMLLGFTINEAANARNRLTAEVLSLSGAPLVPLGSSVLLTEDGVPIFGGVIDAPAEQGVGGQGITPTATRISASDNSALAERRVLNLTFPAGTIKSWLNLLIGYLSPFGTTLDPAQANGPTLATYYANYMRVDDVLNAFSDLTAGTAQPMTWEIDYANVLRMKVAATAPAPFNVVDGDRHALGDVTVEPSQEDYCNRVLLLAGDGLHDVQEEYTGDGTTATFTLHYPVSATRGFVTNGTALVEPIAATDPGTAAWWSLDLTVTPNTMTRHPSAPAAGNAITINYTAQFPVLAFADAPGGIPTPPGLWERIIREPDVFDLATAQQLANGYVAQLSARPRTIRYVTQQRGVHPGQTQHIHIADRHVDLNCLITEVNIDNGTGKAATRSVTAVEGSLFVGSWRDMIRQWNMADTGVSGSRVLIPGGGGGGGGSIGPGTPGSLAKWITATTIGDSGLTEAHDGSTGLDWLHYAGSGGVEVSNTVQAFHFKGRGDQLTDLPASALIGFMPASSLPQFFGDVASPTPGSNTLLIQAGAITDAKVAASAAIAWSKISKAGALLSDLGGNIGWPNLPSGSGVWNGAPLITGTIQAQSNILPAAGAVVNLGAIDRLWSKAWIANLNSVTFTKATQTLFGGYSTVSKNAGTLVSGATAAATKLDFGTAMTPGDWVLIRAHDTSGNIKAEYIQIGALDSGTTYNVTRDLANASTPDPVWATDTPWMLLGHAGDGRIDMLAYDGKPRTVYSVQGATYNVAAERAVLGNLNGYFGYSTDVFGAAFGDPAKAWIKVDDDPTTGGVKLGYGSTTTVRISPTGASSFESGITIGAAGSVTAGGVVMNSSGVSAGSGNVKLDASGLYISPVAASGGGAYANTNAVRWTTDLTNRTAIWRSDDTSVSAIKTWNFDNVNADSAGTALLRTEMKTRQTGTLSSYGEILTRSRVESLSAEYQIQAHSQVSAGPDAFCYLGATSGGAGSTLAYFGIGTAAALNFGMTSPTLTAGISALAGGVNVIGLLTATGGTRLNGYLTQKQGQAIYPGSMSGLTDYQVSYLIGAHSGFAGLYTNGGFGVLGVLYVQGAPGMYLYAGGKLNWANDAGTLIDNDVATRIRLVSSNGGAWIGWDGSQFYPSGNGTQSCGYSANRWSVVYAVNGTINTSDERQKLGIRPSDLGAEFLRRLSPVAWQWRESADRREYHGVTAQAVAAALGAERAREMGGVEHDANGIPVGLNYSVFVAPLINGWQDHDRRLAALEARAATQDGWL